MHITHDCFQKRSPRSMPECLLVFFSDYDEVICINNTRNETMRHRYKTVLKSKIGPNLPWTKCHSVGQHFTWFLSIIVADERSIEANGSLVESTDIIFARGNVDLICQKSGSKHSF